MKQWQRGNPIVAVLATVDEVIEALERYGVPATQANRERAARWIIVCAQAAAEAALEDITAGRVGTGSVLLKGNDEDYLDIARVRRESEDARYR